MYSLHQASNHEEKRDGHDRGDFATNRKGRREERNDRNRDSGDRDSVLPISGISDKDEVEDGEAHAEEEGELEHDNVDLVPEEHASDAEIGADLLVDDPAEFRPELGGPIDDGDLCYTTDDDYDDEKSLTLRVESVCYAAVATRIEATRSSASQLVLGYEGVSHLADLETGSDGECNVEDAYADSLDGVLESYGVESDDDLKDGAKDKDGKVDRYGLEILYERFYSIEDAGKDDANECDDDDGFYEDGDEETAGAFGGDTDECVWVAETRASGVGALGERATAVLFPCGSIGNRMLCECRGSLVGRALNRYGWLTARRVGYST